MYFSMTFIFIIHFAATCIMAGVIWTIQILHYPFFHQLNRDNFARLMNIHRVRISCIVIPVMLTELATGIYLWYYSTSYPLLFLAGLCLIGLIWLSTFLLQTPRHAQIADHYIASAVSKLVLTNWIRTVLWTIRVCLLLYIGKQTLVAVF